MQFSSAQPQPLSTNLPNLPQEGRHKTGLLKVGDSSSYGSLWQQKSHYLGAFFTPIFISLGCYVTILGGLGFIVNTGEKLLHHRGVTEVEVPPSTGDYGLYQENS